MSEVFQKNSVDDAMPNNWSTHENKNSNVSSELYSVWLFKTITPHKAIVQIKVNQATGHQSFETLKARIVL